MSDDMRDRMVAAVASTLGVTHEAASEAMHNAWEATKDVREGSPPSWQPDLTDPGQALAHRVQMALEREFAGEPLFSVVTVVEDPATRRIGMATTLRDFGSVEQLLMLGRGAARRAVRQA